MLCRLLGALVAVTLVVGSRSCLASSVPVDVECVPVHPPRRDRRLVAGLLAPIAADLDENRRHVAASLENEARTPDAYGAFPLHAAKLQVLVELLEVEATRLDVA